MWPGVSCSRQALFWHHVTLLGTRKSSSGQSSSPSGVALHSPQSRCWNSCTMSAWQIPWHLPTTLWTLWQPGHMYRLCNGSYGLLPERTYHHEIPHMKQPIFPLATLHKARTNECILKVCNVSCWRLLALVHWHFLPYCSCLTAVQILLFFITQSPKQVNKDDDV